MLHRSARRALAYLFGLIIVANGLTYLLLCLPEREVAERAGSQGAAYTRHMLAGSGGVWALQPWQRCIVHCAVITSVILVVFGIGVCISRFRNPTPHGDLR